MPLDPRVQQALAETFERLSRAGQILSSPKLATCYETFRRRFGPNVLASLDGDILLSTLKLLSNHDSLA